MNYFLVAATVLGMAGSLAVAATPNETAKAWQVFDSIYGADLARVKATPHTADDLALAAKLLDDAKVLTAHPALLECLCEKAFDLGARRRRVTRRPSGP